MNAAGEFHGEISITQNNGAIIANLTTYAHCNGGCFDMTDSWKTLMAIQTAERKVIQINGDRAF